MMPPPNLRSIVAQGGRWVVSRRRNFSSSRDSSVESKGLGERDFGDLNVALQVLIGVTSAAAGYGLGHVFMGTIFDVPIEKKFERLKKLRKILESQSS